MKIKTKTCVDCGEELVLSFDNKGEFIRYKKMCPCLVEIMKLRSKRYSDFAELRAAQRKGAK